MGASELILCNWNLEWCLASRGRPESVGCALTVHSSRGPDLASQGFVPYRSGTRWNRYRENCDGITFFPKLFYNGIRTYPWGWNPDPGEPLINCIIDQSEISGGGLQATLARMQSLIDDGWAWDQREGGCKLLHIDELEKIEGPPPDGTF